MPLAGMRQGDGDAGALGQGEGGKIDIVQQVNVKKFFHSMGRGVGEDRWV